MDSSADTKACLVVTFHLDDRRFGLPLEHVVRVERAAAVTPLAGAPPTLLGAINHRGRLLPVVDLRRRLKMPTRPIDPEDHFIVARCGRRTVVVPVDRVEGLTSLFSLVAPWDVTENPLEVEGLVPSEDGILVVQAAERLLNPSEEQAFDEALENAGSDGASTEPASR